MLCDFAAMYQASVLDGASFGTSTATILAHAILMEGIRSVVAGASATIAEDRVLHLVLTAAKQG